MALCSSQPLREMNTRSFTWSESGRLVWLTTSQTLYADCLNRSPESLLWRGVCHDLENCRCGHIKGDRDMLPSMARYWTARGYLEDDACQLKKLVADKFTCSQRSSECGECHVVICSIVHKDFCWNQVEPYKMESISAERTFVITTEICRRNVSTQTEDLQCSCPYHCSRTYISDTDLNVHTSDQNYPPPTPGASINIQTEHSNSFQDQTSKHSQQLEPDLFTSPDRISSHSNNNNNNNNNNNFSGMMHTYPDKSCYDSIRMSQSPPIASQGCQETLSSVYPESSNISQNISKYSNKNHAENFQNSDSSVNTPDPNNPPPRLGASINHEIGHSNSFQDETSSQHSQQVEPDLVTSPDRISSHSENSNSPDRSSSGMMHRHADKLCSETLQISNSTPMASHSTPMASHEWLKTLSFVKVESCNISQNVSKYSNKNQVANFQSSKISGLAQNVNTVRDICNNLHCTNPENHQCNEQHNSDILHVVNNSKTFTHTGYTLKHLETDNVEEVKFEKFKTKFSNMDECENFPSFFRSPSGSEIPDLAQNMNTSRENYSSHDNNYPKQMLNSKNQHDEPCNQLNHHNFDFEENKISFTNTRPSLETLKCIRVEEVKLDRSNNDHLANPPSTSKNVGNESSEQLKPQFWISPNNTILIEPTIQARNSPEENRENISGKYDAPGDGGSAYDERSGRRQRPKDTLKNTDKKEMAQDSAKNTVSGKRKRKHRRHRSNDDSRVDLEAPLKKSVTGLEK